MSAQPELVARLNDEDRMYEAALRAGAWKREELDVEPPASGA
jgi:hypothetical protein